MWVGLALRMCLPDYRGCWNRCVPRCSAGRHGLGSDPLHLSCPADCRGPLPGSPIPADHRHRYPAGCPHCLSRVGCCSVRRCQMDLRGWEDRPAPAHLRQSGRCRQKRPKWLRHRLLRRCRAPDWLSARSLPPESSAAASPSGPSTSEPGRLSAKGGSGSSSVSTTSLGTERRFTPDATAAPAVKVRQPTMITAACAMATANRSRVATAAGGSKRAGAFKINWCARLFASRDGPHVTVSSLERLRCCRNQSPS